MPNHAVIHAIPTHKSQRQELLVSAIRRQEIKVIIGSITAIPVNVDNEEEQHSFIGECMYCSFPGQPDRIQLQMLWPAFHRVS